MQGVRGGHNVRRRIPDEFQPCKVRVHDVTQSVAISITGQDGTFPWSLEAGGWMTVKRLQRKCCS